MPWDRRSADCAVFAPRSARSFPARTFEPEHVRFGTGDGQPAIDGAVKRGGSFVIDYDADRLITCRTTYRGNAVWSIVAHVQVDGGPVVSKLVAGKVPTPGGAACRTSLEARMQCAKGATARAR